MKSRFISIMDLLQLEASKGELTLQRVFVLMGKEGHAFLMLFLCLPFVQPLPIPGLSLPLGVLISIVAFFHFKNIPPWLPQRFENIKISSEVLLKVTELAEKLWSYILKIVRERYIFFIDGLPFRVLNLVLVFVNALLLSLPLPIPFSNTIPAVAIILSAIGSMERDGLFILLSYLWCLVVAMFFISLALGAKSLF